MCLNHTSEVKLHYDTLAPLFGLSQLYPTDRHSQKVADHNLKALLKEVSLQKFHFKNL